MEFLQDLGIGDHLHAQESEITSVSAHSRRIKNTRQNVLKPKYVVYGLLKCIWVTFDEFLKNFRGPDDFFAKFWKEIITILKIFQKVIKSYPERRKQPVNIIFQFQNILTGICG